MSTTRPAPAASVPPAQPFRAAPPTPPSDDVSTVRPVALLTRPLSRVDFAVVQRGTRVELQLRGQRIGLYVHAERAWLVADEIILTGRTTYPTDGICRDPGERGYQSLTDMRARIAQLRASVVSS